MTPCPRCLGSVLAGWADDDPLCINCGWRNVDIPPDVLAEVQKSLGKRYVGNHLVGLRRATGNPPLNGWEKEKRRRAAQLG